MWKELPDEASYTSLIMSGPNHIHKDLSKLGLLISRARMIMQGSNYPLHTPCPDSSSLHLDTQETILTLKRPSEPLKVHEERSSCLGRNC